MMVPPLYVFDPESVKVPAPTLVNTLEPLARMFELIVRLSVAESVRITNSALLPGWTPAPPLRMLVPVPDLSIPLTVRVAAPAKVKLFAPVMARVVNVLVASAETAAGGSMLDIGSGDGGGCTGGDGSRIGTIIDSADKSTRVIPGIVAAAEEDALIDKTGGLSGNGDFVWVTTVGAAAVDEVTAALPTSGE